MRGARDAQGTADYPAGGGVDGVICRFFQQTGWHFAIWITLGFNVKFGFIGCLVCSVPEDCVGPRPGVVSRARRSDVVGN